jgi:cobalt/nickel transport protein
MRAASLVIALLLLPCAVLAQEKWSGADQQAEQKIVEITGGEYEPWFSPLWEPPSGEIETFLFSLQAALGALAIGYFVGYFRGVREGMRRTEAR